MSDISPYRTPQLPEPELMDDKFMGWASKGQSTEYYLYLNWPFRICLGDWSSDIWRAYLFRFPLALFFFFLGARDELVLIDYSLGYTPLMRAKAKYNKAVRYFHRVRDLPAEINRHEDLLAFKQMLHHLDWRAATGDISEKLLKQFEKRVDEFEARYYPKQLDGPEATKLLSEIKP